MFGIHDILGWIRMRIRIFGSVPLTYGSGRGPGWSKNIRILHIWIRIRIT